MSAKLKILVVENATPLAMLMVSLLTRAGCNVSAAHTGEKGMELALEKKFGLIVLAVELPGISGPEICAELKQRHLSRRTPIIFVAGQPCEEGRQRCLELGAADYIAKPFSASDFVSRVLSHINPTPAHV